MGYIGYSRSERSAQAIESYEVPLSMIKKELINEFIESECFELDEVKKLQKTPVKKWREVAKFKKPTSWHHTSNRYNKTNHYALSTIADYIINNFEKVNSWEDERKDDDFKYGVIEVQIWCGSVKHPKLLGTEIVSGIIKGNWLHTDYQKYKLNANKTINVDEYETYSELTKKYKQFKNTKRYFNAIIKKLKK